MPNLNWFNPLRSLQEFKARKKQLSFAERLEGVYRIFVGRMNQPETISEEDYVSLPDYPMIWEDDYYQARTRHLEARMLKGQRSTNHAGLYDVITFGVANTLESFFSGNFIPFPAPRLIWQIVFSPFWVPLNIARALFGTICMAFAILPLAFYHNNQQSDALTSPSIAASNAATPATQTPLPLAEAKTKVSLTKVNGAVNLAKLNELAVKSETSFWKIRETTTAITATLKSKAPKHLERYAKIMVAAPADTNTGNHNYYSNRLKDALGAPNMQKLPITSQSQYNLSYANENIHGVGIMTISPSRSKTRSALLGDKDMVGNKTYAFIPRLIQ